MQDGHYNATGFKSSLYLLCQPNRRPLSLCQQWDPSTSCEPFRFTPLWLTIVGGASTNYYHHWVSLVMENLNIIISYHDNYFKSLNRYTYLMKVSNFDQISLKLISLSNQSNWDVWRLELHSIPPDVTLLCSTKVYVSGNQKLIFALLLRWQKIRVSPV